MAKYLRVPLIIRLADLIRHPEVRADWIHAFAGMKKSEFLEVALINSTRP